MVYLLRTSSGWTLISDSQDPLRQCRASLKPHALYCAAATWPGLLSLWRFTLYNTPCCLSTFTNRLMLYMYSFRIYHTPGSLPRLRQLVKVCPLIVTLLMGKSASMMNLLQDKELSGPLMWLLMYSIHTSRFSPLFDTMYDWALCTSRSCLFTQSAHILYIHWAYACSWNSRQLLIDTFSNCPCTQLCIIMSCFPVVRCTVSSQYL